MARRERTMKFGKRLAVLGLVWCVFCGVSFAATNPEWRPFKLGIGQLQPRPAPPRGEASHLTTVEITLVGGFTGGFGLQKADSLAPDLLTGRWSPWFGQGFTDFGWGGGAPNKLDGFIAGPMLKKAGGTMAGIILGFRLSSTMQFDFYFEYGFSGYAIDDNAWAAFSSARDKSIQLIQSWGRTVDYPTNSFKTAGKTILGGVNLNIGISTTGPVKPYVTLGAGIMSVSDYPSVAWSMTQAVPGSSATYNMEMKYESKIAPLVSGGLGFIFFLDDNYAFFRAPNYGIKIEGRVNVLMIDLAKNLATGFARDFPNWLKYDGYSVVALNETGFPVTISIRAGVFCCF